MAIGARRAFDELPEMRDQLQRMPFLGCDGLPKTGQDWVRRDLLTATIFIPPNADLAMELMVKSITPARCRQRLLSPRPGPSRRGTVGKVGERTRLIVRTDSCPP